MDFDFTTETITPDNTNILTIGGSGGLEISVGTTAERPVSPVNGTVRYNTDLTKFEFYQNNSWVSLASSILTTKGDLLTHNSTAEVRLPVGTDGSVIIADSTTATGLAWIPNPVITQDEIVAEPTGFVNRTDSVMSFNDTTREFTIAPVSTSFTFYQRGIKFVKTSAETVTLTDVSAFHFITYNTSGVLQVSLSPFIFNSQAPVAFIYWNSVAGKHEIFGEERHGLVMDWATHQYLHTTQGARYVNGFGLSNFTLTGTGNSNIDAQVGVEPGIIADEDIRIQVVNSASPSAIFEQTISPTAELPILYRLGATGDYYKTATTTYPVKMGTTYPQWNEFNGSSWSLTETASNTFIAMWVIVTNDINEPVISFMGQHSSATLEDALEINTLGELAVTVPFLEFRPLYRLIYEVQSSYTNSVKSALRNVLDLRLDTVVSLIASAPPPGSVSSVGLSLPSIFSITGSPVTSAGTLGATFNSQSANTIFAGPLTGSAEPTFRTLSINELNDVVVTSPVTNNILQYNGTNWVNSTSGTGTVTSVSATGSTGLAVGGSPITTSGTLTFTLDTGLQNLATLSSTGLVVSNGTDTWATRFLSSTTGDITVSNGNGVAGNPSITFNPSTSVIGTALQLSVLGRPGGSDGPPSWINAPTDDLVFRRTGSTLGFGSINIGLNSIVGTSVLRALNGGTGQSSYTVGDILFANSTTTLSKLADVATGNSLISGGVGVAPSWGKIGLTTHVTGTLPIANGGTALSTTPTNGQLLIGNGTGYTLAALTSGTGTSVTNGAGSITIANTGVLSITTNTGLSTNVAATGAVTITNTGVTSNVAGTGISVSGATGAVTISNTGVTSFTITQPVAGITATNTGSVQTGAASTTLALANDLLAVEGLATTGLATRTGTDTWATRTINGTTNTITVTNGNGVAGNPTITIADNTVFPGTAGNVFPAGTTAQRPVSPAEGTIRYNTTLGFPEIYYGGVWYKVGTLAAAPGVQGVLAIYTGSIPATSGVTSVPYDNTPPLSSEGTRIWSTTITPTKATSEMRIIVPFTVDCGTSNRVVISSMFRDAVNIGTSLWFATGGGRPNTGVISVSDAPGTTSPVTYSMRTGVGAGSATWYVNSTSIGNNMGGALISTYQITEIG